MNQQTKDKLDKLRDTITNEYAPLFKSESLSCYTLTGYMLTGRSRADFQQGFDSLSRIVLELVRTLKTISDKKTMTVYSHSEEFMNGATAANIQAAEICDEALSNFDKFLEGKK